MMLVPRPTRPTQTPEEAMLASFDERVDCPVCLGRKATLSLSGHAEVCGACNGSGSVSRFYADDYAARGKD